MTKSTHLIVVVDRSGSMGSIRNEAESGLNELIQANKELGGDCSLSLYEFDNVVRHVYRGPIAAYGQYILRPGGMTALYDAVGRAIDDEGSYLRDLEVKPEVVILVVVTDGQENTSHVYNQAQVRNRIKHQETKYSWEISFLGCGRDVALQAVDLGFDPKKVTIFAGTGQSVNAAYHSHAHSLTHTRSFGAGSAAYASIVNSDGTVIEGDANRTSI